MGVVIENHQLINATSGDVEYGSPPFIIEAARSVLGKIDLDPATSREWNAIVKAVEYYTKDHNGLLYPWGTQHAPRTVWLNWPFSGGWTACDDKCKRKTCENRGYHVYEDVPDNAQWVNKITDEYAAGRVREGLCICFAATSEKWFQNLLLFPQCYLYPRTNYYKLDGTVLPGVSKGSVVTYFGTDVSKFDRFFGPHGTIKIKYYASGNKNQTTR
jgi:hypothetical protein